MRRLLVLAIVLLGCSGDDAFPSAPSDVRLRLEIVASGLDNPVHLTAPRGDRRLFVVEQSGRIRIVQDGQLLSVPFLDISSKVNSGGESGLLGLAFDPAYHDNGFLYVDYTDRNDDTAVERYQLSADPQQADPASASLVLGVSQPYRNHNGGHVLFGPDGMLYVAMGDGGSAGDPHGHGQNRNSLLGKLLRIDIGTEPYAIPGDNPFVGQSDARGEIWAYGLRNPWRVAFDPADGLLYIADVGQNQTEEVNVMPAGTGWLNYGWNIMEGAQCYQTAGCARSGLTSPVVTYTNADGACSVIGGIVYRGEEIPELRGHYFYGDYCAGWVRSFRYANGQLSKQYAWQLGPVGQILSFGEDAAGAMYLLSANGNVYRFQSEP